MAYSRNSGCSLFLMSNFRPLGDTVIPYLMHTPLDALPHLMHTKSGNQLGSCAKIIKFKGCMHIHLRHTETLPTSMFYFARYRFSLVNTKGTDTVMLSSLYATRLTLYTLCTILSYDTV